MHISADDILSKSNCNRLLSEILDSILPNIGIPVSYHKGGGLDIIPCIYIDDKTVDIKEFSEKNYPEIFNIEGDIS